jgi:hypothetical protein
LLGAAENGMINISTDIQDNGDGLLDALNKYQPNLLVISPQTPIRDEITLKEHLDASNVN